MLHIISGFWLSRAVYVAAKLGLADLISDGPKTAPELATATNTHAPSLYRVVRALATAGIFFEDGERRFHMTPLATTLQTGVPGSLRSLALTELGEEHYPAWENVLHSVRTGEIAFDQRFGMPIWEFFGENPENAAIFNDAMTNLTSGVITAIMAAYDFSAFKTVADIGGGQGSLVTTILKAYPNASGIL
ncbi:MAG TPA: methyltransferase, partial [Blastocatellia bacterium]|nr:methyltransferase [Blastocatellia bacterium]